MPALTAWSEALYAASALTHFFLTESLVTLRIPSTNSRTFKTLILTASKGVVSLSGLLLLMLLSRLMSEADYGGLRQLTSLGRIALPLLLLGLPQALIYFVPKDRENGKRYLRVATVLYTGAIVCFALLCLVFSGQIAAYYNNSGMAGALLYIVPWVWALGLLMICMNALLGLEKPMLAGAISALHAIVFIVGVVSVSLMASEYIDIIKAYGAVPFLSVLPIFAYTYRKFPKEQVESGFKEDAAHLLKYSVPLSLSQFVGNFGRQISLLIVAPLLLVEEFGIYANGAIELPLVSMLTGSAVAVITPEIVRLYGENRREECVQLWQKAAEKTALIIFPIFVFFMFNAENFMVVLFSEKYFEAAVPFRIFLLLLPMRIIYFGTVFIAAGRSQLMLLRSIGTTSLCALFALGIAHYYGPMYAPFGLVLAIYGWALPYNIFWYKRLMGMSFIETFAWGRVSMVMFSSLALSVVFLPVYFLNLGKVTAFLINAVTYFGVYVIVMSFKKRKGN